MSLLTKACPNLPSPLPHNAAISADSISGQAKGKGLSLKQAVGEYSNRNEIIIFMFAEAYRMMTWPVRTVTNIHWRKKKSNTEETTMQAIEYTTSLHDFKGMHLWCKYRAHMLNL